MTTRLFWDRAGSGEPLLLLHGIGSTHDDFVALRPQLDARFRVLAPDLPGHGHSSPLPRRPTIAAIADAIEADLDESGVGTVHVLGNSIGARIALEFATRGRARSVVAISPSGMNTPTEPGHAPQSDTPRSILRLIDDAATAAGRRAVPPRIALSA